VKFIGRYLSRFLQLWLFWFWAPVLDVLAFLSDPYIPGFSFPREVYLAIPIIGFIVTNIRLFAEQKQLIEKLDAQEANLEVAIISTEIYVTHLSPSKFDFVPHDIRGDQRYNDQGFDGNGIPASVIISTELLVTNAGRQPGLLSWRIDRSKTRLPSLFKFREDPSRVDENGFFEGIPVDTIEGKTRHRGFWHLRLDVVEQNPHVFAQKLPTLNNYRIFMRYHTDRIGSISESRELVIEGSFENFRRQVIHYWRRHGLTKHVQH